MRTAKKIFLTVVIGLCLLGATASGSVVGTLVITVLGLMFTSWIWIPAVVALIVGEIVSGMDDPPSKKH